MTTCVILYGVPYRVSGHEQLESVIQAGGTEVPCQQAVVMHQAMNDNYPTQHPAAPYWCLGMVCAFILSICIHMNRKVSI